MPTCHSHGLCEDWGTGNARRAAKGIRIAVLHKPPVVRRSLRHSAGALAMCFGLPRLAVGAGFFMKPVTLLLPCFQVGAVFGTEPGAFGLPRYAVGLRRRTRSARVSARRSLVLLMTKPVSVRTRAARVRPTVTMAMVSWLSLNMVRFLRVASVV